MIDKTFWSEIAACWVREDNTEIPDISDIPEEDMDAILKEINDEDIFEVDDILQGI